MPASRAPHRWTEVLKLYRQPRLLIILLMGFASGLPLALTGATLQVRLKEAGVSLGAIGFFALVQLSYNLKALWAPVLDHLPIPLLSKKLGQRRSWIIVIEIVLAAVLVAMGATDPSARVATVLLAVLVAFLSASQDVVIDAYRIEILSDAEQGAGAAATQLGYRLGMLVSGAGALVAAEAVGWGAAYALMALFLLVGIGAAIMAPMPTILNPLDRTRYLDPTSQIELLRSWGGGLRRLGRFIRKILPADQNWLPILCFLLLYKLGSSMAEHMATPLYVSLGFTKIEIAEVSKLFGTVSIMVGVTLGGVIVYRIGILRALLLSGILQTVTNGLYILLAQSGHDVGILSLTIGADNLAIGINSAAIVAYLSSICGRQYTATQYALLSALMLVGRNVFAAFSGVLAETLGWTSFFALSMVLAIPGLLMLLWLMRVNGQSRPGMV